MQQSITLSVEGMKCPKCPPRIKEAFAKLQGIATVEVDLEGKSTQISYDADVVDADEILSVFDELPFSAEIVSNN